MAQLELISATTCAPCGFRAVMRLVILTCLVSIGVLLSGVALAEASSGTRIYIVSSACGAGDGVENEGFKPQRFTLGCSGAGGNFSYADHVAYHHYGRNEATATATFHACLLSPPGMPVGPYTTWRPCPEAGLSEQELAESAYRSFPGTFRFSHIVRCYQATRHRRRRSRLFYSKMSYTYAGRPWIAANFLTQAWGDLGWECPAQRAPHAAV